MPIALSNDQITELLKPVTHSVTVKKGTTGRTLPPQEGPLRFFDKEMRCSSRGCSSATYAKVQGVPRCSIHALHELNEMLVGAGFKGVQ